VGSGVGVIDGSRAMSGVVLSSGTGLGGVDGSGAVSGGRSLTWLSGRESRIVDSSGSGLGAIDGAVARSCGSGVGGSDGSVVRSRMGSSMGVLLGPEMLVSNSHKLVKRVTWLSVWGASGEPGDGCWRAVTMSLTPAMTMSVEVARGIGILDGNHERVSAMRMALVSQIQHW